ncbi:sulfatase [Jiangella asiatica]|uniref:Sulfatase n=1 Tax=Jiangella asiatica TaxID=2530372 RepID=A0A4R5CAX7_9ACTN|nr:sulfatase [Jiangella asiatica]TDD95886.1 sulfatase [Jiangella asiatica]
MTQSARPNIVLIHWHDTGRYLGAYGRTHARTPHLDALARDAVVFDNAFSTAPLCSPARGSLFTGRYPHSNGLMGLAHLGWEYHANEQTLPMLLAPHGYESVLVGLQHESADASTLGYDEVIDVNADRQAAPVVAELAVDKLGTLAQSDTPFLMVVGMFEPHRPFPAHRFPTSDTAPVDVPPYLPASEGVLEDLRAFNAAVTYADEATGRILTRLRELGLYDNTIVVFTTDHGIPFPRAKSTLFDSGIEVALLVRLPGSTPPRPRCPDLVSHVDLVPTLLDVVGAPVPVRVQGVSFAAQLGHGETGQRREEIYAEKNWHGLRQYDPIRCVRTNRYKYIVSYEERPMVPLPVDIAISPSAIGVDDAAPRSPVELYDLEADPHETRNLAGQEALVETEKDLAERLASWQHGTQDPLLHGLIPAARRAASNRGAHPNRTEVIEPQFVQRS